MKQPEPYAILNVLRDTCALHLSAAYVGKNAERGWTGLNGPLTKVERGPRHAVAMAAYQVVSLDVSAIRVGNRPVL